MKKFYHKLFRSTLSTILTVVISCLAIVLVSYAATTISANIVTGGTLAVTGLSTFTTATSTSATSTAYLYVGPDFSEDTNMNFTGGDLMVADALNVGGVTYLDGALQATSTSLFTGAANFYSTVNVTGLATFTTATSTSATSTAYLYVGADGAEPQGWDFSGGDLFVTGDAYFNNKATSSVAFAVGSGTINNLDMAGGDLYVQGAAEFDGTLYGAAATFSGVLTASGGLDTGGATTDITLKNDETIGNATNNVITFSGTTMAMATTTATTTVGVWISGPAGTATSSLIIGGGAAGDAVSNATASGCIQMYREGVAYRIMVETVGTSGLRVEAGTCN